MGDGSQDATPVEEVTPSESSAPTESTDTQFVTPSTEASSAPVDVVADAPTPEVVAPTGDSDADEPEVQIAAEAAVVEAAVVNTVFNIIDEDSKQYLVRYEFSTGLILRKFVTSDEEAAIAGRVYRDAALEKGITLVSVTKA